VAAGSGSAYIDIDAHYGDGVQAAFWADPRVLTISVHQHPATLSPFTGLPVQTGGPGAEGSAVKVALPARSSDAAWLRAFHAVVSPLLWRFRPQILVSQHGNGGPEASNTHSPLSRSRG
jgi:acetoin utilization protein AcuC